MQKIYPCLWFENQAEDAVNFYSSIFKKSKIKTISRYSETGQDKHQMKPGQVMMIEFEIDGNTFTAFNGGPQFKITEAISFQIYCDSQKDIDYYWDKLSKDGDENAQHSGWLKDKFGVSWQIVPAILNNLINTEGATASDRKRIDRVMSALLQMKKIDLQKLVDTALFGQ